MSHVKTSNTHGIDSQTNCKAQCPNHTVKIGLNFMCELKLVTNFSQKTFLPDVNQPQGDMSSKEGDQQTQQGTIRTQRLHDKNTDPQNDALIKAGPKPADTQNIQILKLLKIMHKRLKIYHQQN